jgi:hypothetical protein
MCIAEGLREQVQEFQRATGEEVMVVVIEKIDDSMAVHRIGFNPFVGLMVDGKPPTARGLPPLAVGPEREALNATT